MTFTAPRGPCDRTNIAARRTGRASRAGLDMSVSIVSAQSPERAALEASITRKFANAFGAQLTEFMPELLHLGVAGAPGAVVGIRPACRNALFLEQYLDTPIEQAIARAFGTPVDRAQIVEIGNLAANVAGLAYTLFALLASVLDSAGYRWVSCTATPQVVAMLAKMGFPSQTIRSADPARLEHGAADWGDYYAACPQVVAGDVRSAAARVAAHPVMSTLVQRFAQPVAAMGASLRKTG